MRCIAHLSGVTQRGSEKPFAIRFDRDHAFALGEDEPPERHHVFVAHRLPDDRVRFLGDRRIGRDVIRSIKVSLVDLLPRHESVDLDDMGAFDFYLLEFFVLNHEILVFADFVSPALLLGQHGLTCFFVDQLLAQAMAGLLVDLPERDPLRR